MAVGTPLQNELEWTGDRAVSFLCRHPGFASLNAEELRAIVGMGRVEEAADQSVVFHQGDRGDFAYLVLSGEMVVDVETDLGSVTVAVIGTGGMVGEIAAFADRARTATVSARGAATLLRIERAAIHRLLDNHPSAAMSIIGDLGDRLLNLNGTLATLTLATTALAKGEFRPEMLTTLKDQADRISQFADVFADMAHEISQKRARKQEMDTAAEIQRSFLPRPLPDGALGERCSIAATMVPAKDVGGDFYDFFMLGPDRLGVAVGDVSGKGVPAAMFMSVSRTMLKAVATGGGAAGEVLTQLNSVLTEEDRESMFVTLFFAILDLRTGAVEYASAGHDEVFLVHAGQPSRELPRNGPAIGLIGGITYPTMHTAMQPGDALLLATDGVTEAFDPAGEMFGRPRLEALLNTADDLTAGALVAAVNAAVDRFADGAERSDDTTCLAVQYCGRS